MEAHLHQKKKKAKAKSIASHDLSNWNDKIKQIKTFGLDLFFFSNCRMWLILLTEWISFFPHFGRNELPCFSHHSGGAKKKQNKKKKQTQNTWWGLQKLKRAQAQHQHNAFYSPKFQNTLKSTQVPPLSEAETAPPSDLGGQMWNKTNLYLQDKSEKQKIHKSSIVHLIIWG